MKKGSERNDGNADLMGNLTRVSYLYTSCMYLWHNDYLRSDHRSHCSRSLVLIVVVHTWNKRTHLNCIFAQKILFYRSYHRGKAIIERHNEKKPESEEHYVQKVTGSSEKMTEQSGRTWFKPELFMDWTVIVESNRLHSNGSITKGQILTQCWQFLSMLYSCQPTWILIFTSLGHNGL